MKAPRLVPLFIIIQTATLTFSPPLSPHIREGISYSSTAFINTSKTVEAQLFVLAWRPVIFQTKLSKAYQYKH